MIQLLLRAGLSLLAPLLVTLATPGTARAQTPAEDATHCIVIKGEILSSICPYEIEVAWCVENYNCRDGALSYMMIMSAKSAYQINTGSAKRAYVRSAACRGRGSLAVHPTVPFSWSVQCFKPRHFAHADTTAPGAVRAVPLTPQPLMRTAQVTGAGANPVRRPAPAAAAPSPSPRPSFASAPIPKKPLLSPNGTPLLSVGPANYQVKPSKAEIAEYASAHSEFERTRDPANVIILARKYCDRGIANGCVIAKKLEVDARVAGKAIPFRNPPLQPADASKCVRVVKSANGSVLNNDCPVNIAIAWCTEGVDCAKGTFPNISQLEPNGRWPTMAGKPDSVVRIAACLGAGTISFAGFPPFSWRYTCLKPEEPGRPARQGR